jgi:DNA-binding PadR family transcriptional regulator
MVRLIILERLLEGPKHGYEIQQFIQEQQMEIWTNALSGSLYFALKKMEAERLIKAEGTELTGNRKRKKFAITETGRQAFFDLLKEGLASPPHSLKSDFSLALSMSYHLDEMEITAILKQNMARIEEMKASWEVGREYKGDIHPAVNALFENELAVVGRDLDFLGKLFGIIQSDGARKPIRRKATHFRIRYSGMHRGHEYFFEEVCPVGSFADTQMWERFRPETAAQEIMKLKDVYEGETFVFKEPGARVGITAMTLSEKG